MRLGDLSGDLQKLLFRTYTDPAPHPFIEMRVVNVEASLSPAAAGTPIHIWVRISHRLPDSSRGHAAGLAYLSDWWLNFIGAAPHLKGSDGFYVVSLNHSTWFHAPCRADEWILCVNHSPNAGAQRALSLGEFFTQDGRHIATAAQQALLTNRMRSYDIAQ